MDFKEFFFEVKSAGKPDENIATKYEGRLLPKLRLPYRSFLRDIITF